MRIQFELPETQELPEDGEYIGFDNDLCENIIINIMYETVYIIYPDLSCAIFDLKEYKKLLDCDHIKIIKTIESIVVK